MLLFFSLLSSVYILYYIMTDISETGNHSPCNITTELMTFKHKNIFSIGSLLIQLYLQQMVCNVRWYRPRRG